MKKKETAIKKNEKKDTDTTSKESLQKTLKKYQQKFI